MKILIVIALAVVMALSLVLVLAACGGETVTGEYSYENYGHTYGAKVDVTVKGGIITAVKLYTNEEAGGWVRTTESWKPEGEEGGVGLGYAAAEAAYEKWIEDTFVGKTVEEVNAYVAEINPSAYTQKVEPASANLAGATQSAVRIILAVQNALSKLAK